MNHFTKKVIAASALTLGAVTAAGAASYAATGKLVSIAMDRPLPKASPRAKKRLSGTELPPLLREGRAVLARKLEQRELEAVRICAADGTWLSGHWYSAENPKRVVVAMHGWRSSWSADFGILADFWIARGCSILFAEQRGHSHSGGQYIGFGLLERSDCLDWVNWVNTRTQNLPIYLWGVSMGASTVLMASDLVLPDNVAGIIADCGYTSPQAIWEHIARHNLGIPYGRLQSTLASRLCRRKIQVGIDAYACPRALKRCRVPVLLIHGAADRFVPVEMTYENYEACAAPKKLFIVPGAGHGMSYVKDPTGYRNTVTAFWRDCES